MGDIGILEACGILGAISAGVGGPIAIVRWCAGLVAKKVEDSERSAKTTTDNLGTRIANVTSRMDAVEHKRSADIERVVKLETNLSNLEKGQDRIEKAIERLAETLQHRDRG